MPIGIIDWTVERKLLFFIKFNSQKQRKLISDYNRRSNHRAQELPFNAGNPKNNDILSSNQSFRAPEKQGFVTEVLLMSFTERAAPGGYRWDAHKKAKTPLSENPPPGGVTRYLQKIGRISTFSPENSRETLSYSIVGSPFIWISKQELKIFFVSSLYF